VKTADNQRLRHVYIIFALLFLALFLRIGYLQIFRKTFFNKLSQSQYYKILPLEGRRGDILDCRGRVLAASLSCYSVFADPVLVENPESSAKLLAPLVGISEDRVLNKLKRKGRFVWLKRKISFDDKQKIKALKIKGLGFIREEKRFYPQEEIGSSVLGVVDVDDKGLDGLEVFYDTYLRGKEGLTRVLRDSASRNVLLSPSIMNPEPGGRLILTVDSQIQYWSDTYLQETVKAYGAKAGSVVVMNADTGEIFALSNFPTFNPNQRDTLNRATMRNGAVCDIFEPGSVFKMITLVAAIDKKAFRDDEIIFCENGQYKIPGHILHDWKPYGNLTFRGVFHKSSNIGVGKINERLGPVVSYDYISRFGAGKKTDIDLPGEAVGRLKPLKEWSKTTPYMIPIGQEISVNLVQLTRAFAVVVNGGYMVKPHILKKIIFSASTKETPLEHTQIVSAETANHAKDVLVEVVEEGTGVKAKIDGIRVGGKTGTAQKFDPAIGRYSSSRFRASFVGFVETNPPLVIGVSVDEPAKSHFGGVVAAPLFQKIAAKSIEYLTGKKVANDQDKEFPTSE